MPTAPRSLRRLFAAAATVALAAALLAQGPAVLANGAAGTIIIAKDAIPDDPQNFEFLGNSPMDNFFLDDDADGTLPSSQTFSGVAPGSYTVQELVPDGWDLTAIDCVTADASDTSSVSLFSELVTIDLDDGETITCTFENTKRGTITIVKDAEPESNDNFTVLIGGDGGGGAVILDDASPDDGDAANTDETLDFEPGSYTLSETIPAGWNLASLVCSTDDPDDDVTVTTNLATIPLEAGENVTCTFTNDRRGKITVVKDAQPDSPADFTISVGGDTVSSIVLDDASPDDGDAHQNSQTVPFERGIYTLSEIVTAGWALADLQCSTDATGGGSVIVTPNLATIDLRSGENVTCTFTNLKDAPDLAIAKSHDGTPIQGQASFKYRLDVSNVGELPTSGTVTVVDTLPTGLTATGIAGSGWSCTLATLTCTRADALVPGASYQKISVTVMVSTTAAASVTNIATVSGSGELVSVNNVASDPTSITQVGPAPVCNGQQATIWVALGRIIGGPSGGNSYSGALPGSSGADVIVGTNGSDVVAAGGGHDVVCLLGGADVADGGSGRDVIIGGAGLDVLGGGNGDDTLTGGFGPDVFSGGGGTDTATDFVAVLGDTKTGVENF